jgi:hypothetical protein
MTRPRDVTKTCSACRGSDDLCSQTAVFVLAALADTGPLARQLFHAEPLEEMIARGFVEDHGGMVNATRTGLEHTRVRRELDFDEALIGSVEEAP